MVETTPSLSMEHGDMSAAMFPPPYPLQKYISTGWGYEVWQRWSDTWNIFYMGNS